MKKRQHGEDFRKACVGMVVSGLTVKEVATTSEIHPNLLRTWMKKADVKVTNNTKRIHTEAFKNDCVAAAMMDKNSVASVAEANKVHPNLLRQWMKKFGIGKVTKDVAPKAAKKKAEKKVTKATKTEVKSEVTLTDFSKSAFEFVETASSAYFVCPAGNTLTNFNSADSKGRIRYKTAKGQCKACDYFGTCTTCARGRSISVTVK